MVAIASLKLCSQWVQTDLLEGYERARDLHAFAVTAYVLRTNEVELPFRNLHDLCSVGIVYDNDVRVTEAVVQSVLRTPNLPEHWK